ncbi:TetR/AcrR family transcriptional regulator [Dermacoccus sp. 147Ba]|nr:TetR/AcrR family transcriptional regulator [Dermacoccus sp. 147Ba]
MTAWPGPGVGTGTSSTFRVWCVTSRRAAFMVSMVSPSFPDIFDCTHFLRRHQGLSARVMFRSMTLPLSATAASATPSADSTAPTRPAPTPGTPDATVVTRRRPVVSGADQQGRRARNKADKQARILAAAESLLGEVGYERMTTAEVAKRANVAAGTVFQYAPTKAELLMMVVEHEWRDLVDDHLPDDAGDGGVRERVLRLLEPFAQQARDYPENAMVVGREVLFGAPGPYREKVVALVAGLEDAIAALLVAAGGDAERSVVAAGLIVSGGVLELNRTRTGRAEVESVARRLGDLVDVAVRGAGV